jgi:hypothetical protein
MEEMAKRWQAMDFGGKKTEEDMPFDPSLFKRANRNMRDLRALARAGRDETERLANLTEGMKKIVWGEPEGVQAEDTIDAASIEEEEVGVDSTVVLENAPSVVPVEVVSNPDLERFIESSSEDGGAPASPNGECSPRV